MVETVVPWNLATLRIVMALRWCSSMPLVYTWRHCLKGGPMWSRSTAGAWCPHTGQGLHQTSE
jgi:hypothetical protein